MEFQTYLKKLELYPSEGYWLVEWDIRVYDGSGHESELSYKTKGAAQYRTRTEAEAFFELQDSRF